MSINPHLIRAIKDDENEELQDMDHQRNLSLDRSCISCSRPSQGGFSDMMKKTVMICYEYIGIG